MKKLSKILESIWSDMQDRGTGDAIKKEEDFTKDEKNDLERLYLMGYIKSCVYTYKNPYDFSIGKFELYFDDEWERDHRFSYQLDGEDKETKKEKDWSYFTRNWDKGDNIQKKIEDKINEYEEKISKMGLKRKLSYDLIDTLNFWWRSLDDDQKRLCFLRASEFVYTLDQDELDELDEWDKQKLDLKWSSFSYDTKLYAYDSYTNWSDEVDESIWSDMQDRGTEDSIKKEDDTFAHFAGELKKKYEFKHPEEIETEDDYMVIPMFKYTTYYSNLEMQKTVGGKKFISFSYRNLANATGMTKQEQKGYDSLLKALDERFDTKTELTANDRWFDKYIRPKDGREINNNFFIEVLDFIIDTLDRLQIEYYQRFVYKLVKESIWSEMQDRGTGDIVKKEDDINLLTQDALFEYIKNRYVSLIDAYPFENWHKPRYDDNRIVVPFASSDINSYVDNLILLFKENEKNILFHKDLETQNPDIYKLISDNYKLSKYSKYLLSISPLDGSDVTNKFYIDLIDFLIDNMPNNEIVKRK